MRWGLIPSWVKDPRAFSLLINARGETVRDKPAFRAAMRHRRGLVPADGFYEWQAGASGKQPYFIRPKSGAPIAFAALYETWSGPNGEELDTVALITTPASADLAALHDRMPAVIVPDAFDLWLNCAEVDALTAAALLIPAPRGFFEWHPVSKAVNRAGVDTSELLAPIG
jgi:putative SOS response-associated peptidase YedK